MCEQQPESPSQYEANRENLHAYYSNLLSSLKTSGEQFDKAILTLSAGALGLSLTFIKEIISVNKAIYLWLLGTSWTLLTLTILLTLISFLTSRLAFDRQIDNFEAALDAEEFSEPNNPFAAITSCINYTTLTTFTLAVIMLYTFVLINFNPQEDTMCKDKDSKTEQSSPKQENAKPIPRTPTVHEFDDGLVPRRLPPMKAEIEKGLVPTKLPKSLTTKPPAVQSEPAATAKPSQSSGKESSQQEKTE